MNRNILLVDDDPLLLKACHRQLRKRFDVSLAVGAHEGLEAIAGQGPFAVVVADMRMPKMDGVQFLSRVRELAPDTVRVMLTGNADQQVAIDAINHGAIFRFLNKPCSGEELVASLESAAEHHRLITAERELLTKTLSGSVGLLADVLALTNPMAFGCGSRLRQLARQIADKVKSSNTWEIEVAAMLSKLGCVAVPESALRKASHNAPLCTVEASMLRNHPEVGARLLGRIPRLEGVARIIRYQDRRFDGSDAADDEPRGDQLPLGARILKLAIDCDALLQQGSSMPDALVSLQRRAGWYDPELLAMLTETKKAERTVAEVSIDELEDGMVLADDVRTLSGGMLLARGTTVSQAMRERLRNFALSAEGIRQPLKVRRAPPAEPAGRALEHVASPAAPPTQPARPDRSSTSHLPAAARALLAQD